MDTTKLDIIIDTLHERWKQIEFECKERGHINRRTIWINYCHVQEVNICEQCYRFGQQEHTILHDKLMKENLDAINKVNKEIKEATLFHERLPPINTTTGLKNKVKNWVKNLSKNLR